MSYQATAFACSNVSPPVFVGDAPKEVRSPNGGFSYSYAGTNPLVELVDDNGFEVLGSETLVAAQNQMVFDEFDRGFNKVFAIWEPDSPMTDARYRVEFGWGETTFDIVKADSEPSVEIVRTKTSWTGIEGGSRLCCRLEPHPQFGPNCRDDCVGGVDFCETCEWSSVYYHPTLSVDVTTTSGPYIGVIELQQGDETKKFYFATAFPTSTVKVIGDGDSDGDLCVTARLINSDEETVASSETKCVSRSSFGERPDTKRSSLEIIDDCPGEATVDGEPPRYSCSTTPPGPPAGLLVLGLLMLRRRRRNC